VASPPDPSSLDRPWVGSYPPGVPPTYRFPAVRLPRLLDDAARDFPDHTGVIVGRTDVTFGQLRANVITLERGLAHQGIEVGDRVLVMLPTGISLFIVLVALWRRGATAIPVPDDADPERVAGVAADAEVVAMIGSADAVTRLRREAAAPQVAIVVAGTEWVVDRTRFRLPRPRLPRPPAGLRRGARRSHRAEQIDADAVVTTNLADLLDDAARAANEPFLVDDAAVGLTDVLADPGPVVEQPDLAPTADGPALVAVGLGPDVATAVEHSHRTLLATAFQARLWVPDVQAARERMLVAEPLHDIVGLAIGLLSAVLSGATTILLDDPSPADLAKAIERHQPTLLVARSRRLAHLLDEGDGAKRDLTSLRVALSVGDDLPPDVARDLERRSGGARFRTVRGAGDAAPITHGQPVYGRAIPTAVGLPVTDTLAIVVEPDDLSVPCAVGEAGLLLVRGPQIPEVGAACGDGRSVDGWLVTDEVARVDGGGWFTVLGHREELVDRDGDAVPAARLGDALRRRPDVRAAEVVAVDGAVVAAVISARRRPPHPEDLLRDLATEFDDRALPDRVVLVTEFPHTESGAVDRERLEEQLRALVAAEHAAEVRDNEGGAG
jgi:long-chain acyl-CoA synthetase